ncbi:hypothetical protein HD806DRAFT_453457 [Xylariaceae sp. AK1471]|nr:hypothetical protein HD806DRAFT_453457 [Xylariaceae sp. AK1471]
MTTQKPQKGDKVSWNWGSGAPGGKVVETKDKGEIAIKSKRGNTIKKNASPDNPAVHIERSGNDVVKRASELTVEEKAPENNSNGKRKAKTREDPETDGSEDEELEEASDQEDPHTKNKQGKEVKKGGKAANKRQKRLQDEDTKGKIEESRTSKLGEENDDNDDDASQEDDKHKKPKQANGNKKSANMKKAQVNGKDESKSNGKKSTPKAKKDPAPRNDGDMVSTRTRSQGKSK